VRAYRAKISDPLAATVERLGELVLGDPSDPTRILRPTEFYVLFNSFDAIIKASVLLCSCYSSGVWVEDIDAVRLSTHPNLMVHSACQENEKVWPLRSTSNKYRCCLFSAAVAEALDPEPRTTADGYEIS
jgi:hypothetical protein